MTGGAPLFGLAVPAVTRASALRTYAGAAAPLPVPPFAGWSPGDGAPRTVEIPDRRRRPAAGARSVAARVGAALARAEAAAAEGAFVTVCREHAEHAAATLDDELAQAGERGPLHGVPVAVKDNIAVRGLPLTAGSRVLGGHVAAADAAVVGMLRRAGAVVVGKTALDEFAFATVGEGVTNPRAPDLAAGGSSSGSAAAVAVGACDLALGTDTGGSVRIPAACCGVVGLKPTIGTLPTEGVIPLAWTLDHVGLLARNVAPVAAAYAALVGSGTAAPPAATVRLGVPAAPWLDVATPEVRAAFACVLDTLRGGGVEVGEVALPSSDVALDLQYLIVLPEAAAYHRAAFPGHAAPYSDGVRDALAWGEGVAARDYLDAQRARSVLRAAVDGALADVDALLLPTLAVPPPRAGQGEVTLGDGRREDVVSAMLRLTCAFDHSGHPAVSLPLPGGDPPAAVQLVGRRGGDGRLLALARRVEEHLGG